MSAGLAVPQHIFSHGFLFNRGEKMSKSVGNVVDPFTMADAYGVDQLRFFFLREIPFGQDGNYSHEAIVNRINADLANDLGNLAQRSLSMVGKAFGGVLPAPAEFTAEDKTILAAADAMLGTAREHMKTQALHQVLNAVWAVVADANRYFAAQAPWALAKTDPKRQGTVLYVTAEVLRRVAICSLPTMPTSGAKLLDLLAVRADERDFSALAPGKRIAAGVATAGARAGVPALCRARSKDLTMLVDSHCHLDFPDFASELDAVVARAGAAGVGRLVTICTRVRKFPQVLAVAERFPEIFCSVGTHPHNAKEETDIDAMALVALTKNPKVVAIGEAGLDYHYDNSPREAQAASLRQHIVAARETGLPLVIHSRDCDADMARILQDESGKGAFPAVLHCFTGGRDLAFKAIALGHYVSFTGILTFKNSQALRDIAAALPADRILVETDAPYLAPLPYRGKRNEPAYVAETAKILANCRGVSADEIARQTTENFFRLFNKVPRSLANAA